MKLEEYFDFQHPNDIRIKGHRIGIESILYEYIHRGLAAEQIARKFPTLMLEQVYAAILYYLHNKDAMDRYLSAWLEFGHQRRQEQKKQTSPFLDRIRHIKAERSARQQV